MNEWAVRHMFFLLSLELQRFHFQCEFQQWHSFSTWTTCNGPNSTQSMSCRPHKSIVWFLFDPLNLFIGLSFDIMLNHSHSHIWLPIEAITFYHRMKLFPFIFFRVKRKSTCRHWNRVLFLFVFPISCYRLRFNFRWKNSVLSHQRRTLTSCFCTFCFFYSHWMI